MIPSMRGGSPEVVNNHELRRFEIRIGDEVAQLTYKVRGSAIELIHTEVPLDLEGQGFGNELARAALEYAAAQKLEVIPSCSFLRSYMRRHSGQEKLTERTDD